jgi:glutathione S-transferase
MKFYYAPKTCALATHIALEESGASYEAIKVDFSKGEQTGAEYLAINPKGRVPVLITGKGTLTETPALLAYVAQIAPAAKLAPVEDAFAFADMQAFNSYLCSTVHPHHAHAVRGTRWADDPAALAELKRKVPGNLSACFRMIDGTMLKGPWVMGDVYSVADPYLFTVSRWLAMHQIDVADFPKVSDHLKRMQDRPSVQRVIASH